MIKKIIIIVGFFFPFFTYAAFGDTNTFLSAPYYGDGKHRLNAFFDTPYGITMTKKGGMIIADTHNHVIRKITPKGKVFTVAGNASAGFVNGKGKSAEFSSPKDVAIKDGTIFVVDSGNGAIRKITPKGNVKTVTKKAGMPEGIAVQNNTLFFTDTQAGAVKKISLSGGDVKTVATGFTFPEKIALSSNGEKLFVSDSGAHTITQITIVSGESILLAGKKGNSGSKDGECGTARFAQPSGVYSTDDFLFVADRTGSLDRIRRIDVNQCAVVTVFEDSDTYSLGYPRVLTGEGSTIYMLMTGFGSIQKIEESTLDTLEPVHFAGADRFSVRVKKPILVGRPKYLLLSRDKKTLFFSENNRIRRFRFGDTKAPVVAGSVIDNYAKRDDRSAFKEDARFSDISSMALSKNGKVLYVVDRNNNRIRRVNIATGEVSYLTGAGDINSTGADNGKQDGVACPNEFEKEVKGCAYFNRPMGAVLSKDGNYLYVTDSGNNSIRQVVVESKNAEDIGMVKTIAGSKNAGYKNGIGTEARFHAPIGMTRNKKGTALFVADRNNHVIRKINIRTRSVTTLAGTPQKNGYAQGTFQEAVFSYPEWISRGPQKKLYVSTVGSHTISELDLLTSVTRLVSGSGSRGIVNGKKESARYNTPRGMVARKGKLYVADMLNDTIRVITVR